MPSFTYSKIYDTDVIFKFWNSSIDSTIFTHPKVLTNLSHEVEWWMVFKGAEPIILWPVCIPDFKNYGMTRFLYYVGPLRSKTFIRDSNHEKTVRVYEALKGLLEIFKSQKYPVVASLPLTNTDTRCFSWYNEQNNKKLINIYHRYTAIIENLNCLGGNSYINNFNENRKRELKDINKKIDSYETDVPITLEEITLVYRSFFEEKNININTADKAKLKNLYELVADGYGYLICIREKKSNKVISFAAVLNDSRTANLVINITIHKYKNKNIGTYLLYLCLLEAKKRNISVFDMNGCNTYSDAFFKHSFGSKSKLYFELEFIK